MLEYFHSITEMFQMAVMKSSGRLLWQTCRHGHIWEKMERGFKEFVSTFAIILLFQKGFWPFLFSTSCVVY